VSALASPEPGLLGQRRTAPDIDQPSAPSIPDTTQNREGIPGPGTVAQHITSIASLARPTPAPVPLLSELATPSDPAAVLERRIAALLQPPYLGPA
jgi:hypothetical protein